MKTTTIPLRLLGLFLLALAMVIPGCQALFARASADAPDSAGLAATGRP